MRPAAPTRQTVAEEESGWRILVRDGEPPVAKRAARETGIAVESLGAKICHQSALATGAAVDGTGGETRRKKGAGSNRIGSGRW
jgi:hypothetical protein